MSRALDKSTIAALKVGNPQAAYSSISSILTTPPSCGRLEIEILGKEIPLPEGTCVLQDGISVGISKLGLVQAFLVARKILQDHITGSSSSPQIDDDLFAATAVILLMDPEFLTAANTRKRLIQKQLNDNQHAWTVLTKEEMFLDSLLTSRLHRHTKSPTLWNHRRWLVGLHSSLGVRVGVLGDLENVVFLAGERHPRNYYAWCHARYLVGLEAKEWSGYNPHINILAAVKKWCFEHHQDISGWSFLYHLLDNYDCSGRDICGDDISISSTFSDVLNFAASYRVTNESLWVFLRTLAASGLVGEKELEQFTTLGAQFSQPHMDRSGDSRVLRSALDWYETYQCRKDL